MFYIYGHDKQLANSSGYYRFLSYLSFCNWCYYFLWRLTYAVIKQREPHRIGKSLPTWHCVMYLIYALASHNGSERKRHVEI